MVTARFQLEGAQKNESPPALIVGLGVWMAYPIPTKAMMQEQSNLERLCNPIFLLALLLLGSLAAFEIVALVLSS